MLIRCRCSEVSPSGMACGMEHDFRMSDFRGGMSYFPTSGMVVNDDDIRGMINVLLAQLARHERNEDDHNNRRDHTPSSADTRV